MLSWCLLSGLKDIRCLGMEQQILKSMDLQNHASHFLSLLGPARWAAKSKCCHIPRNTCSHWSWDWPRSTPAMKNVSQNSLRHSENQAPFGRVFWFSQQISTFPSPDSHPLRPRLGQHHVPWPWTRTNPSKAIVPAVWISPMERLAVKNVFNSIWRNLKSSVKIVYEWQVSHKHEFFFPELTIEVANCLSWGHKAGAAVYQWLQTVKWQSPVSSQEDDFGITYLELLFNFVLVTGCMLPVTISKKSSATHFGEFHHPSSAIVSKRARSAAAQGVVLIYIIRQLEMLLQVNLIPATRSIGISSLLKLGYNDMHKKTGFKQRPELLYGKETIAMMENFLKEKDPIVDSLTWSTIRIRLTMHTFLILIWSNLRHMRWRGILSTIRKNTKFLPPQTVWFDSTRRVSVCSCRVEGIEWFGVIHLCRKFHVIWIFRALLPYQRCWGEALWPWSHAEASKKLKTWTKRTTVYIHQLMTW